MTVHSVAIGEVAMLNPKQPVSLGENGLAVPFLPMAAIRDDGGAPHEQLRRLADVTSGYTYFEKGDVLLAKITPCFENGKVAHLETLSHPFGFGSTEFHVLKAGPDVDPRYLYHAVRNPHFRRAGASSMTGSAGQQRVPATFVARHRIPLPPLAEQRRIAAMLGKADAVQRNQRVRMRLLNEILRSVFLDMFGDPVRNQHGWEMGRVGDVISETQYGTSVLANSHRNGLPVLRMNNITPAGAIDLRDVKWCEISARDFEKYTLRRGDMLFNRTNSPELVGKTAVWDLDEAYAFAGYLVRVRFDHTRALPEYISGYLNSSYGKKMLFEKAKPSINMSNISPTELKRLPIMLPPLDAQARYRELLAKVKAAARQVERAIPVCESLYDSLAQRAFEGDLRESASRNANFALSRALSG